MEGEKVHIVFWWKTLKERYRFEDLDQDGRIKLKCILNK
jgi:hypothetical protein